MMEGLRSHPGRLTWGLGRLAIWPYDQIYYFFGASADLRRPSVSRRARTSIPLEQWLKDSESGI